MMATERPNSKWICTAALIVAAMLLGARFGLPWYRNQRVKEHVESLRGSMSCRKPPAWLLSLAGQNVALKLCNSIVSVNLGVPEAGDDDLRLLHDLPELESLSLHGSQVTDAGLAHLRNLPKLKYVILSETRITDNGLVHLGKLPGLQSLNLGADGISAAAPRMLRTLTGLRELMIPGRVLSDENILDLQSLTNLQMLRVYGTSELTLTGAESLKEHIPGLSIYW